MVEVKAYEKIVGLGFSIGQPLLEDRKRKNRWEFTNYTDQQTCGFHQKLATKLLWQVKNMISKTKNMIV